MEFIAFAGDGKRDTAWQATIGPTAEMDYVTTERTRYSPPRQRLRGKSVSRRVKIVRHQQTKQIMGDPMKKFQAFLYFIRSFFKFASFAEL